MQKDDLLTVTHLANQLGYPVAEVEVRARFEEIQNDPDYALFVAVSEKQEVLGYIQINLEPKTLLAAARVDIAALVVDVNNRSKGIGTLLLKTAEEWAKATSIPTARVRSNSKREAAHRFYQREGYALSKNSNIFVKELS